MLHRRSNKFLYQKYKAKLITEEELEKLTGKKLAEIELIYGNIVVKKSRIGLPCINEGNILEYCQQCNGELKHVRECDIHGKCTRGIISEKVKSCQKCTDYIPDPSSLETQINSQTGETKKMDINRREAALARIKANAQRNAIRIASKRGEVREELNIEPQSTSSNLVSNTKKDNIWAYGITSVRSRLTNNLLTTIGSLENAGFPNPHLFVDDYSDSIIHYNSIAIRKPVIKSYGNWYLALTELYIRNPTADLYALFQDDIICSKNLKDYLNHCEYPSNGYLNLITYPTNEDLGSKYLGESTGWYASNQLGKGAQGLVFNREIVLRILTDLSLLERFQDVKRGWQNIDGAIVTAMRKQGLREYVHTPSLIRHTGKESTMGHPEQPMDRSFMGEDFDLLSLIKSS